MSVTGTDRSHSVAEFEMWRALNCLRLEVAGDIVDSLVAKVRVTLAENEERIADMQGGINVNFNAETIARQFHERYEWWAPTFGYETRKDTREFDPASPNGLLMQAVVRDVVMPLITAQTERAEAAEKQLRTAGTLTTASVMAIADMLDRDAYLRQLTDEKIAAEKRTELAEQRAEDVSRNPGQLREQLTAVEASLAEATSKLASANAEIERLRVALEEISRHEPAWPHDTRTMRIASDALAAVSPEKPSPSPELCGFLHMVTVPPGITKPMFSCPNPVPCADHPRVAAVSSERPTQRHCLTHVTDVCGDICAEICSRCGCQHGHHDTTGTCYKCGSRCGSLAASPEKPEKDQG